MSEIDKVVQSATFVVNGYSFGCKNECIRILNCVIYLFPSLYNVRCTLSKKAKTYVIRTE